VSAPPDLRAAAGFVEPAIHEEFPGLRLDWLTVPARLRDSPRVVKHRLRALANRYRGAEVVAMRTKPIPLAYRTFFRQIGLDPDTSRVPSERAAVARLLHGGFRSIDLVQDALLIAVVETGVPVWALISYLRLVNGDVDETAAAYGLSLATIEAARAYYRRNKKYIDARILLNTG